MPPGLVCEHGHLTGRFKVTKYENEAYLRGGSPYEEIEGTNLLLTAGSTIIFQRLGGVSATAFDATNGRICVGNGTTAVAVGQTDLQGASKFRKVFDAAPTISTNSYTAVATFGTADANFSWDEAGIANSSSGATLLNRIVQAFGVKTSSLTWVMTFSATIQ